jgi:large conductance mechanosensitive channel
VKGFRAFITKGNLISLAVAVVIGTAFTAVVTALVTDLITPLIGAIVGKRSFPGLTFTVNHSPFYYGAFINAALTFLIIAAVVYYLLVAPMAKLTTRLTRNAEATTRDCPECLSTIPIAASRCMYCTVQLPPMNPAPAPQTSARHRAAPPQFHQPQQPHQPQPYQQ